MPKILTVTVNDIKYSIGDKIGDKIVDQISIYMSDENSYVTLLSKYEPVMTINNVPTELEYFVSTGTEGTITVNEQSS